MGLISVYLKYLLGDLPVIVTGFICMWFVVNTFLITKKSKRWLSLILIEGFEHLIFPILFFFILIIFNNWLAGLLFHIVLNLFLFGFVGLVIVKARTKDDWLRVGIVAVFTYFFVFFYPFLVIQLQRISWFPFGGWEIMILTVIIFFLIYTLRNRQ